MVISKNRPTSKSGPAGYLLFDPITHTLTETFGEEPQSIDEMAMAA